MKSPKIDKMVSQNGRSVRNIFHGMDRDRTVESCASLFTCLNFAAVVKVSHALSPVLSDTGCTKLKMTRTKNMTMAEE